MAAKPSSAATVRRRTQAEILPKVAEAVPGVVAVRSELGWSEDDA